MVLSGHVKNGMIVLDAPVALPEGTAVSVAVSEVTVPAKPDAEESIWAAFANIWDWIPPQDLMQLPADGAERHDHYLAPEARDCP